MRERQTRYQELHTEMETSGAKEVSLTDPDSRRMHKIGVGYNGQIAVDEKHKLIVAQEVTNEATDHGQLAAMSQAAREALEVETLKAVAAHAERHYDRRPLDKIKAPKALTDPVLLALAACRT